MKPPMKVKELDVRQVIRKDLLQAVAKMVDEYFLEQCRGDSKIKNPKGILKHQRPKKTGSKQGVGRKGLR